MATPLTGDVFTDRRTGKNTRHGLTGMLRQSVYSRLAGYEDTNDAERLSVDPAMRHVVGARAKDRAAASTTQMGRFETEVLTMAGNLEGLMGLPGQWVDRLRGRRRQGEIAGLEQDQSSPETTISARRALPSRLAVALARRVAGH